MYPYFSQAFPRNDIEMPHNWFMPTVLMAAIVTLFDAVGMLFGGNLPGLSRTHPPTAQRLARLLALAQRR